MMPERSPSLTVSGCWLVVLCKGAYNGLKDFGKIRSVKLVINWLDYVLDGNCVCVISCHGSVLGPRPAFVGWMHDSIDQGQLDS